MDAPLAFAKVQITTNNCGVLIVDRWSLYFAVATSPCHAVSRRVRFLVEKTWKDERRSCILGDAA
jgi:hypothetical protein